MVSTSRTRNSKTYGPRSASPATLARTPTRASSDSSGRQSPSSGSDHSSVTSPSPSPKSKTARPTMKAARKTASQAFLGGRHSSPSASRRSKEKQVRKARKQPRTSESVSQQELVPCGYSGLRNDLSEQTRMPTHAELMQMDKLDKISYTARGSDEAITYALQDNVLVIPPSDDPKSHPDPTNGLPEVDLWRGRIVDIRTRPRRESRSPSSNSSRSSSLGDLQEVYVKLAWYYSPAWYPTLKAEGKGYRARDFGKNELVYVPSHTDWQQISALNGKEEIYIYHEADYDAEDVPDQGFYTRSTYNHRQKKWERDPPKKQCLCKETYKLYEETDEMHYCPRKGCHTWYHETCLEERELHYPARTTEELENMWGKSFDETALNRIQKQFTQAIQNADQDCQMTPEEYTQLKADARRPIIRGGSTYGVNGNRATTLRARWALSQKVKGMKIPEGLDWVREKQVTKRNSRGQIVKDKVKRSRMPRKYTLGAGGNAYRCPKCSNVI